MMTNEELVLRIKAGETSLMDELWSQVYKFAYMQAGKFFNAYADRCQSFGLELEDIQQESFFAIYKAVEGFKPEQGVVFLTYAGYCLKKAFFDMTKMNYKGWQKNAVRSCSCSLDAPISTNDGEYSLADTLVSEDDTEGKVVEKVYAENLSRDIAEAVGALRTSWRDVIHSVYFIGLRPADIARAEGCARTVVSKKHRSALAYLAQSPVLQAYRI